jgi:hypothetical protein
MSSLRLYSHPICHIVFDFSRYFKIFFVKLAQSASDTLEDLFSVAPAMGCTIHPGIFSTEVEKTLSMSLSGSLLFPLVCVVHTRRLMQPETVPG